MDLAAALNSFTAKLITQETRKERPLTSFRQTCSTGFSGAMRLSASTPSDTVVEMIHAEMNESRRRGEGGGMNEKQPWEIVLNRMIDKAEVDHIKNWWNPFSHDFAKWILLWDVKRQIENEEREHRDRRPI